MGTGPLTRHLPPERDRGTETRRDSPPGGGGWRGAGPARDDGIFAPFFSQKLPVQLSSWEITGQGSAPGSHLGSNLRAPVSMRQRKRPVSPCKCLPSHQGPQVLTAATDGRRGRRPLSLCFRRTPRLTSVTAAFVTRPCPGSTRWGRPAGSALILAFFPRPFSDRKFHGGVGRGGGAGGGKGW